MNPKSEHFSVFAECIPVKGAVRSAIYDLPRNSYKLIPNALYDILTQQEGSTLAQLKEGYEPEDQATIEEYFDMLQDNEYVFFCDERELGLFPKLEDAWDYAGELSNAILELPMEHMLFTKAINQLEALGCRHIQLRSLNEISTEELLFILNNVSKRDLDTIEVVSKADPSVSVDALKALFAGNPRLRTWILHGSAETALIKVDEMGRQNLILSTEVKHSHRDFERNGPHYFNVNIELFFESKRYNAYYNRKACITSTGDVKNCFSLQEIFGNVGTQDLASVIRQPSFQKLWHASHDRIEVCKLCEFRYMCTDNTPLVFEGDQIRKEKACFYDPLSATFTHDKQLV